MWGPPLRDIFPVARIERRRHRGSSRAARIYLVKDCGLSARVRILVADDTGDNQPGDVVGAFIGDTGVKGYIVQGDSSDMIMIMRGSGFRLGIRTGKNSLLVMRLGG